MIVGGQSEHKLHDNLRWYFGSALYLEFALEYVHVLTKLVRGWFSSSHYVQTSAISEDASPERRLISRSHRHRHGCLQQWGVVVVVGDHQQVLDMPPNLLEVLRTKACR